MGHGNHMKMEEKFSYGQIRLFLWLYHLFRLLFQWVNNGFLNFILEFLLFFFLSQEFIQSNGGEALLYIILTVMDLIFFSFGWRSFSPNLFKMK